MEVMVMVGMYAGRIRDIHPFYAKGMIERGEALDPNAPISEVEPAAPVAEVPAKATEQAPKPRRERRTA